MPRSKDLDSVAPDDLTPNSPPPADTATPKATENQPLPHTGKSASSQYRQKVYDILGHTKTPFSSTLVKPKVFTFIERDDDEDILVVLRRHWITNVPWILISFAMLFVPSLISFVPLFDNLPLSYQFAALFFWYLVTFAYALEQFYSWYFNVYIITEERVIDIDFNNLLNKKFTEAKLTMIQDVTSSVRGVSQTIFNYGDVLIQTASEIPEIVFNRVPNPEKIIKVLGQLRIEEEQEALDGRVK